MRRKAWSHERQAGSEHWLTPPKIIQALGAFDLDPCAAPSPRPWPTAAQHIEPPQDGLTTYWTGRVWLNPPYGRHTSAWLKKLAWHLNGVALVFARTDTDMFHNWVFPYCSGILFLRGWLSFYRPDGTIGGPAGAASCLVAYDTLDKPLANADALRNSGLAGFFIPNDDCECFTTAVRESQDG